MNKYKNVKYLIYILALLLFIGCEEEKDCLEYSENSGLIIREASMGKCYSVLDTSKIFINDTVAYKQLAQLAIDSIQQSLGCAPSPSRPELDFDSLTLLGAKTVAEGCIVSYNRNVTYNNHDNSISYTLDVHQCGECNEKRISMNWVVIDKIDTISNLKVAIKYY